MSAQGNPYRRQIAQRSIRKMLIVCEGEKTEPNYFRAFTVKEELIKIDIHPAGRNKDSLVEYTIKLKRDAESKKEEYSEIWCVFDRDSYLEDPLDKHKFNRAIALARNNQIKTAYSNDAFEIWYILHFEYYQTAGSRNDYIKKLTKLLGSKYNKNDLTMYKKLEDKQKNAIQNAKKLLAFYAGKHKPESDNPCTTVHLLVERLNALANEE